MSGESVLERPAPSTTQSGSVPSSTGPKSMTLIAFSGDMDKLLAALSIASSAAAMGVDVTIFFTFWGLSALRRRKSYRGKTFLHRALNALLPSTARRLSLSRKNMLGAGPAFFRVLMKKKHVGNVHELVETAQQMGVRLIACTMSMDVMGLSEDELVDGVCMGGAAACVRDMMRSESTLFV